MSVLLARLYETKDGTFGALSINGIKVCVTVERPWKNNDNGVSCIPAGTYKFTRFKSPHNGDCFLLQGVPNRDMIEIHAANVASQLKGCIAPGKSFAVFPEFEGAQGVTSSKLTLLTLFDLLPNGGDITITNPMATA